MLRLWQGPQLPAHSTRTSSIPTWDVTERGGWSRGGRLGRCLAHGATAGDVICIGSDVIWRWSRGRGGGEVRSRHGTAAPAAVFNVTVGDVECVGECNSGSDGIGIGGSSVASIAAAYPIS